MAYSVRVHTPDRKLGHADQVFKVWRNDEVLGRLMLSKGGVEWFVKNGRRGYRLKWGELAELLEEYGRR